MSCFSNHPVISGNINLILKRFQITQTPMRLRDGEERALWMTGACESAETNNAFTKRASFSKVNHCRHNSRIKASRAALRHLHVWYVKSHTYTTFIPG